MTDNEIKTIFKEECLDRLTDIVCNPIIKTKNADFEEKIKQTLNYLDCDAYTTSARAAFRVFAEELTKKIKEQ